MDVAIEPRADYLYVRMSGKYIGDTPLGCHPVSMARACQAGSFRRLLMDVREVTGPMESLAYFHQGEEIARAFPTSDTHIAIVGAVDRIEMLMFFETVAVNRGTTLKVFTDIKEAIKWLKR